jgi:hypothetical protein
MGLEENERIRVGGPGSPPDALGRTPDEVIANAVASISRAAVTRMEDSEPVPVVGSRSDLAGPTRMLLRLPWSLQAGFAAYAAVCWCAGEWCDARC